MARSTFGQLQEFQPESETIAAYLERASLYFQANSIAEEKQVAVFLSVIGVKKYSLLCSLTAPERPRQVLRGPCECTHGTFSAKADSHCRKDPFLSSKSSSRRIAGTVHSRTMSVSNPL